MYMFVHYLVCFECRLWGVKVAIEGGEIPIEAGMGSGDLILYKNYG